MPARPSRSTNLCDARGGADMPIESRLNEFVAFSAEVTAFKTIELQGTGLAASYLQLVDDIAGAALVDKMLGRYAAITVQDEAARLTQLRRAVFGDERIGPVARNIVKL